MLCAPGSAPLAVHYRAKAAGASLREYTLAYALALADGGADMLSGGDSPAGLLGPKLYLEVALPFEKRVIAGLRSRPTEPAPLHMCSDTTRMLADMAGSGAEMLKLNRLVGTGAACRVAGPEVAIWGNLDSVSLLAQGNPEQVRQATTALLNSFVSCGNRRFVLISRCTLAVDMPAENLKMMFEVTRDRD